MNPCFDSQARYICGRHGPWTDSFLTAGKHRYTTPVVLWLRRAPFFLVFLRRNADFFYLPLLNQDYKGSSAKKSKKSNMLSFNSLFASIERGDSAV
jgi:hypothetical protein